MCNLRLGLRAANRSFYQLKIYIQKKSRVYQMKGHERTILSFLSNMRNKSRAIREICLVNVYHIFMCCICWGCWGVFASCSSVAKCVGCRSLPTRTDRANRTYALSRKSAGFLVPPQKIEIAHGLWLSIHWYNCAGMRDHEKPWETISTRTVYLCMCVWSNACHGLSVSICNFLQTKPT